MGLFQIHDRLSLSVNASLYPYLFDTVKKGPPIETAVLGRGKLQLRYALLDGFLLSVYFNQDLWLGDFKNSSSTFGVGLTLVPGQVPEI